MFILDSDLGGGKTTLTKGLAQGLGCQSPVSSPSFTVSREYKYSRDRTLYHFDFYRLGEAGIVGQELQEASQDPSGIVVIEWADVVKSHLPASVVSIKIERVTDDESKRLITITLPKGMEYLK